MISIVTPVYQAESNVPLLVDGTMSADGHHAQPAQPVQGINGYDLSPVCEMRDQANLNHRDFIRAGWPQVNVQ